MKYILNWQEYVVSVMLICVRNMELTYELHKAIKLDFINASNNAVVVFRVPSTSHDKHIRNCSEEMMKKCYHVADCE